MAPHHVVAMLIPAWGHTVSYIYIATQMLQKDPTLVITMVQHNSVVAQMDAELQTCTYDATRLRIIGLGYKDIRFGPTMFKDSFSQLFGGWIETLPQLAQGSEGWPKPQALHMDFIGGGFVIEPTKQIVGPSCRILAWFSSALVSMPGLLTQYDYATIAREIHSDEARREGRSMDEILEAVSAAGNGSDKLSGVVLQCPGIPDIYDHERVAYGGGATAMAQVVISAQALAKLVDGYFAPTATCLEPVGIPYCRELYQKFGQEIFAVGPQAHELCWSEAPPVPPTNSLIRSFLDNAVGQYGAKSVLYISFGSMFFPIVTPQLVEALVNTLLYLEKPFPFVFAIGAKMASLPKALIETVNASGKGLICDFWVEQRAILQHAALGWFLTHGGFNSISESLSQGIPLIVWPTNAEQPINAALLSSEPNPVAFELLQIRTGPQLAPSLRGGTKITGTVEDAAAEFEAVFAAARGSKGAVLAANAKKMAQALREARAGEASDELIRLARF
ncbi:hypothetical protein DFH09DRAFT_1154726 [Mycena vulgaris]|nr:hypothetical protein DFH09DRAFT_1154726 [Mycena vulgaris]